MGSVVVGFWHGRGFWAAGGVFVVLGYPLGGVPGPKGGFGGRGKNPGPGWGSCGGPPSAQIFSPGGVPPLASRPLLPWYQGPFPGGFFGAPPTHPRGEEPRPPPRETGGRGAPTVVPAAGGSVGKRLRPPGRRVVAWGGPKILGCVGGKLGSKRVLGLGGILSLKKRPGEGRPKSRASR